MAKQSDDRARTSDHSARISIRPQSHKTLEAFLLLGALGILCVLFGFFALELQAISEVAFRSEEDTANTAQEASDLVPPRIEARVVGSELLLLVVDDAGDPLKTLYRSDLADDIADFTVFAVPQTGYRGFIYVRPILDGKLPNLKVYPLDVSTGSLNAATLNVLADSYILSGDETVVGILNDAVLTLYAIEDGSILAEGTVPDDWRPYVQDKRATLSLSESSCLSLTLLLAPEELSPFPQICP